MSEQREEDQYDKLKRLSAEGDLVGVVSMAINMHGMLRATSQANYFRTSIDVAQNKGLLTDRVLGMALEIASEVYLRMATFTMRRLHSFDSSVGTEPSVSRQTLEDMERLAQIEDRIIQMAKARAAISHVTVLSERGPLRERSGRIVNLDEARSSESFAQAAAGQ